MLTLKHFLSLNCSLTQLFTHSIVHSLISQVAPRIVRHYCTTCDDVIALFIEELLRIKKVRTGVREYLASAVEF
jgi:hypothetical protein